MEAQSSTQRNQSVGLIPQARSTDTELNEGPCGGIEISETRTTLTGGNNFLSSWDLTMPYPPTNTSPFKLSFSKEGLIYTPAQLQVKPYVAQDSEIQISDRGATHG